MPAPQYFSIEQDHGVHVFTLNAKAKLIEEPILEGLTSELLATTNAAEPPLVLLDLTATTFFGSGFLETLFRMWKSLQSRPNSKFGLCGLYPYCREVLEITNLDSMWPIYPNRVDAIAAMSAK